MIKLLALISLIVIGCGPVKTWQTEYPDNLIEEMIEDIVEKKLNEKLDLTPFTGKERQPFDEYFEDEDEEEEEKDPFNDEDKFKYKDTFENEIFEHDTLGD